MPIEITVRHVDISGRLVEFARDKAGKLQEEFNPVEFVRVVLDKEGPFCTAEVSVQGGRQMNADSKHRDADMIVAINTAIEKAQTQLRRQMKKLNEIR